MSTFIDSMDFYKLGYNAPNDFVSNYKFLRSDYGWKNE